MSRASCTYSSANPCEPCRMMRAGNGPSPLGRATAARMSPPSVLTCSHDTESDVVAADLWETVGRPDTLSSTDGACVRGAQPMAGSESSAASSAIPLPGDAAPIRLVIGPSWHPPLRDASGGLHRDASRRAFPVAESVQCSGAAAASTARPTGSCNVRRPPWSRRVCDLTRASSSHVVQRPLDLRLVVGILCMIKYLSYGQLAASGSD